MLSYAEQETFCIVGILFMSPIEPHAATAVHICAIPVVFVLVCGLLEK